MNARLAFDGTVELGPREHGSKSKSIRADVMNDEFIAGSVPLCLLDQQVKLGLVPWKQSRKASSYC
jgi:hypothetical protein